MKPVMAFCFLSVLIALVGFIAPHFSASAQPAISPIRTEITYTPGAADSVGQVWNIAQTNCVSMEVFRNGLKMVPTVSYTTDGKQVTFTAAQTIISGDYVTLSCFHQ